LKQTRVFISYSHEDRAFVSLLHDELGAMGLAAWLDDRQLKAGDSILDGISNGIRDTDYFLIVLSRASVTSRWVRAELNSALYDEISGIGAIVIPLQIEDCDVPPLLRDKVILNVKALGFREVVKRLEQLFRLEHAETTTPATSYERERIKVPTRGECPHTTCAELLKTLGLGFHDIRRVAMQGGLDQHHHVRAIWAEVLEKKMETEIGEKHPVVECWTQLGYRVWPQLKDRVIRSICEEDCAPTICKVARQRFA